MKQHLRFMSLVLSVLTLLAVVGCSEGNYPATTATIPMQTT